MGGCSSLKEPTLAFKLHRNDRIADPTEIIRR